MAVSFSDEYLLGDAYGMLFRAGHGDHPPVVLDTEKQVTQVALDFLRDQGRDISAFSFLRTADDTLLLQRAKNAFIKANRAYSFIQAADAIREGRTVEKVQSTFEKMRLMDVYFEHVARDRQLIIPSREQIEAFSHEWGQICKGRAEAFTIGHSVIMQSCEDPRAFPLGYELYKLERDLVYGTLEPEARVKYLKENYSVVYGMFQKDLQAFQELVTGCENPISLVQNLMGDYPMNRQSLIDVRSRLALMHRTAVEDPELLRSLREEDSRYVLDICYQRTVFNGIFEGFSESDLEAIRKCSDEMPIPPEHFRKFVALGSRLRSIVHTMHLNEKAFRLLGLNLNQGVIIQERERFIAQAAEAVEGTISQYVAGGGVQGHLDIQQALKGYVEDRDEHHVTQQYVKDGHRYGESLILSDPQGATLFPGENSAIVAKDALLHNLRRFATNQSGHLDPNLFAMLQEGVCQNLEKLVTEHWIRDKFEQAFQEKGIDGFLPCTWIKDCISLKKESDERFVVQYEHILRTINFFAEDEPSTKNYRVRFTIPIERGPDGWAYGDSSWECLGAEHASLAVSLNPIPLPSQLPPPPVSAAAAGLPGKASIKDEEQKTAEVSGGQ